MKKSLVLFASLSIFSSCSVFEKTTRTKEIPGVVLQTPVLADLDVNNTKVTGIAEFKNSKPDYVRNMAVANALEKSDADVLVSPTYSTTTTAGNISVTVTGYPAKYKNFRPMTSKDTTILTATLNCLPTATIDANSVAPTKKSFIGYIVAGSVGLVLLVLAATGSL